MTRTSLRVRVDDDGPGPKCLGARARMGDRSSAVHATRLRCVGIQFIGMNDSYAVAGAKRVSARIFSWAGSRQNGNSTLRERSSRIVIPRA